MADINTGGGTDTSAASPIRNPIIETSPDTMEAPENIITTVQAARNIYSTFRVDSLPRIQLYAQIEGLLSGNPPYDPADLAAHGLSHIANFNTLDARSIYERGAQAYWNLLNQAENLIKIELNAPPPLNKDPALVDFAEIMARNFTRVLREWEDFETMMNTLTGQIVKFGLSPVLWPDERDWRFKTIDISKFYIQDQAQTDRSTITAVCVESTFTAQQLFSIYKFYKDKKADESPWDIQELTKLLVQLANTAFKTPTPFLDMMDIQKRIDNGDFTFESVYTDGIKLISLFYKEYDEEISHYIFHPVTDFGSLLYFADRQYKNLREGILIFTGSPGELTLHANRGLGHKIYSIAQAMMQLDCSIVDMARWSSTLLLKGLATGGHQNTAIRLFPGTPTDIGTADYVRNDLGANISQLIGASQFFNQKAQINTANSGDDPGMPDRSMGSISPSQARMNVTKEFGVTKNNIAHFYRQADVLYLNLVIKMLKSRPGDPGYEFAQEWKSLCIEEGVPKELFEYSADKVSKLNGLPRAFKSVRATRVAGDGSNLALQVALESLLPISGDFGPREAKEYKRHWIISTFGADYVPVFLQDSDDIDEQAGGASLAGLENNDMKRGEAPVFSPDNEHRAHFAIHMALLKSTIEAIQQGQATPVDADPVFGVAVPHTGQHLDALMKSPFAKSFVDKVKPLFAQVQNYATLNRKNAEAMIKAQIEKNEKNAEQQQEAMSDIQRKDMVAETDIARKDRKQDASIEQAAEANITRGRIKREEVRTKAQNERLKIELEAGNKATQNSLESTSTPELKERLKKMNGLTPSPSDIEKI